MEQLRKNAVPAQVPLKDQLQPLNDARIWKVQSTNPLREVPWTESFLRRYWRKARGQIALGDEPDAEEWSPFVCGDPAPLTDEAALPVATQGPELTPELIPERSDGHSWLARVASWAKGLVQKYFGRGRL